MTYDTLYEQRREDYSPSATDPYGTLNVAETEPVIHTTAQNPLSSESVIPAGYVPRPPDPAIGGLPGLTQALGWSTGLRLPRWSRQLFDGTTLQVSTMGAHPVAGPVGYSTRQDRLYYAVQNLQGNGTPDSSFVAADMSAPDPRAIADVTGGNPNYV